MEDGLSKTNHIPVDPSKSQVEISITPESEEILLILDNRNGLLLLNAIEFDVASLQSKND